MKRKMLVHMAALPIFAGLWVLPAISGCETAGEVGCPEFSEEADFGAELAIDAEVRTFMQAAGRLRIIGGEMTAAVGAACADVAFAAGRDPSVWRSKVGPALVQAACPEADEGLAAALAEARDVSIQLLVEGGECRVSLEAASRCYAGCDVSGGCTPAQLEADCEPGKLAGRCAAACQGTCEGGAVMCRGACSATCTGGCDGECIGTCNGTESRGSCDGECDGQCTGQCDGTCEGACEVMGVTCDGTCTGECSVEFQEPYCRGSFRPPECDLDAECKASCDASIQAKAECTPPRVTYDVVGEGTAKLLAVAEALERHLPVLLEVAVVRGPDMVEAAIDLQRSAGAIIAEAETLSAKAGLCAIAAGNAAVRASIDIQVSFEASARIEGTARAGAGR